MKILRVEVYNRRFITQRQGLQGFRQRETGNRGEHRQQLLKWPEGSPHFELKDFRVKVGQIRQKRGVVVGEKPVPGDTPLVVIREIPDNPLDVVKFH